MLKRIYQTIVINLIPSAHKRTKWMRDHKVFRKLGENVSLQLRKIPLYPECIAFHNNIVVASNVSFLTHDAMHLVFNRYTGAHNIDEKLGCIEIMDNCFIGANSTILQNVKIGPNAIVAAGSFVNRDIPPGEVWGGVPARRIGCFMTFWKDACKKKNGDKIRQDKLFQKSLLINCGKILMHYIEIDHKLCMLYLINFIVV